MQRRRLPPQQGCHDLGSAIAESKPRHIPRGTPQDTQAVDRVALAGALRWVDGGMTGEASWSVNAEVLHPVQRGCAKTPRNRDCTAIPGARGRFRADSSPDAPRRGGSRTARRVRECVQFDPGTRRRGVLGLVVRQGMIPVIVGVATGLVVSRGVTRVLGTLLFGVEPTDPATHVAMAVFMTMVALIATCVPAHRASRVDPMVALSS